MLSRLKATVRLISTSPGSLLILAGVLLSLGSFGAYAAEEEMAQDQATQEPSIGGYSPVSYFTEGAAQKGSPEFSVNYDGNLYYLTSAEQVEMFNADPMHYQPRYNVCPYSLTNGMRMSPDPLNFKVVGDNLLLFHSAPGKDGLEGWHSSPLSDEELLKRADSQVTLLKF